jgi:hypothetical protein
MCDGIDKQGCGENSKNNLGDISTLTYVRGGVHEIHISYMNILSTNFML